ncbi:ornithine cyclodeaminase family protein (plasmid) [Bosea sp. F3-2]|uniref:ornithine cyclodeaminase family protein n=1 Tax=Bosea sp. F3-2 TaxID=2599640 RepID=UPI0011EEBD17|nr:ornithine cyclodeaminase family protein [Bosea sp. F3-2]QEL27227.1 ornithine cyclodeaminase family protein [Bosea sp. F3-2]
MTFVSEMQTARLISHEAAFEPVRRALIAAASQDARVFPAVIAHASEPRNTFSLKSGSTAELAGLKVGSFWPGNPAKGMPRHNSTIIMIDQETGRFGAVIEASSVNAYRTAAADAVAAKALARPDSEALAIFGAGNQAFFECCALARVLPLRQVHVVARNVAGAESFAARLGAYGLPLTVRLSEAEEACRQADVIVTATPSRAALFEADWVRPGTHVASMGSDASGKQELPPELFRRAKLFCDLPSQAVEIGEFQHVRAAIERGALTVNAIGALLEGRCEGRVNRDDITVFDSSGIALQDLHIGQYLLAAFEAEAARKDDTVR